MSNLTTEQILSMYGEGPSIGEGDFGGNIGAPDDSLLEGPPKMPPMELRNPPSFTPYTYLPDLNLDSSFTEANPYTQNIEGGYSSMGLGSSEPVWDPNFINQDGSVGRVFSPSEISDYKSGKIGVRKENDFGGPFQQLWQGIVDLWGGLQTGMEGLLGHIHNLRGYGPVYGEGDDSLWETTQIYPNNTEEIGQSGTGDNPSPKDYPKY